jgi:hypothetical protein
MVPTGYSLSDAPRGILIASFNFSGSESLKRLLRSFGPVQNASEGLGGYLDLLSKPRGLQRTIQGDEQDPDHMIIEISEGAL